jgi:excisionase family DNA binding protein
MGIPKQDKEVSMMNEQKEILEPDEVADMLRIHVRTVKLLANRGELPGFRVGNQWRFRRSDIEKHIEQQIRAQKKKQDEAA